jgi:hypothetical protein
VVGQDWLFFDAGFIVLALAGWGWRHRLELQAFEQSTTPHSPTPVRVLTVSGAAGA